MNRRTFLRRSLGLAAAGLASSSLLRAQGSPGPADPVRPGATPPGPKMGAGSGPTASGGGPGAPTPPATEFKPLRRHTGIFTGRGGTIGWLAAPGSLAVIDTQFPDTAEACVAGLPADARHPFDAVLNTHHHFDHTSGNPVFKPLARTIVAQTNVPGLQFSAAQKAGTVDRQVFADTTFADVWRHECADETILAQYYGPAHTGGDAVIMFERANVVHMGDLVFNRLYPFIDRPGGASARNWVRKLEEAHAAFPADAIYIFGHGNPKFGVTGTRDDLLVMRDLLAAVIDHVEKGIAAGQTKAEVTTLDNLPGFPDFHTPPPNRLPGILGTVYDELTAKA